MDCPKCGSTDIIATCSTSYALDKDNTFFPDPQLETWDVECSICGFPIKAVVGPTGGGEMLVEVEEE